jgi:hypothetical protein
MLVLDEKTVKQIIDDIESNQNKERKTRDFRSHQIFAGGQREHVVNELKKIYVESHHIMRISNVNVLKKVINKKAKVYKDSPKRTVNGKDNDVLNKIYKDGFFNSAIKKMDEGYNRSNCGLLWVQNDDTEKNKYRLIYLNQFTFDVIINNDTLELEGVILSYPKTDITAPNGSVMSDGVNQLIAEHQRDSANDATAYAMWTKDQHLNVIRNINKKTTTIDYIKRDDEDEGKNDLGMLPFIWLTNDPYLPEYPIENPLPDDSIEINILNSTLLTATQKQIGQLLIKYPKGSKINTLYTGFTTTMELEQSKDNDPFIPTTAEYIVPKSDLGGMNQVIMDYAATILSDNGLEGASMAGQVKNFASGFERLVASASVVEIQKENQVYYGEIEEKVFDIIKAYDAMNSSNLFGKDDTISIHYKEPQVITSESDRLDIIERRDELDLDEPHEKYMRDNPSMTPAEAKAKLKRIEDAKMLTVEPSVDDSGDSMGDEE